MDDEPAIDFAGLSALVGGFRRSRGLNLRDAAAECGVSASTLSRIERGDARPDFETVRRLARWAGISIERVLVSSGAPLAQHKETKRKQLGTIESVELQFRADPKLSPRAAESLIRIMRAAYEAAVENAQTK